MQRAALRAHAALRERIVAGLLRGPALRACFEAVPSFERDHFVEEVLGIAYPPLDEPVLERDLTAYAPSGYEELVHAFDRTGLAAGDRFLDLGSGMGKTLLLAALLTGASAAGMEHDAALAELALRAARELGLDGVRSRQGDARCAELEDADVVFMYLPFTGSALGAVLERLLEQWRRTPARARGRFLCAGALDLRSYPELAPLGPAQSWLQVYAWR